MKTLPSVNKQVRASQNPRYVQVAPYIRVHTLQFTETFAIHALVDYLHTIVRDPSYKDVLGFM